MIIAGAAKCRFCDAVFDPRLRGYFDAPWPKLPGLRHYEHDSRNPWVITFCVGHPVFGIIAIDLSAAWRQQRNDKIFETT